MIVVEHDGYEGTVNKDSRINIFGHNAAKSEAMKKTVAKVVAAIILGGVLVYAIYTSEVLSMAGSGLSGLAMTFNANKGVILSLALIGTIAGVVAVTDSLERITDIGSRALSTSIRVTSATATGAFNHVIVPGAEFSLRVGGTVTIQTLNTLAKGVGFTASAVSTVSEGIGQLSVDHPRKVGSAVGISILLTAWTLMLASAPVLIQNALDVSTTEP